MEFGMTAVVLVILAVLVTYSLEKKNFKKKLRMKLRTEYGQKPDMGMELPDYKETAIYYNLIRDNIPEDERVDEITWADLEMDPVFRRLNTTVSCAGEQLLFAWLHRLSGDQRILDRLERKACYFDSHPDERVETQVLLWGLKKESVNYYIPEYIEQLEFQKMPFALLCRMLLASLLVFTVAALLTANPVIASIAGIHFLINIAVYAIAKAKYEVEIETFYGIVRTVKIGEAVQKLCPEEISREGERTKDLKNLSRIILVLDQRKQARLSGDAVAMASEYLLGAFMLDFLLYDRAVRLLCEKKESFGEVYRFVGEVDMSIAVASFRKSLSGTTGYCIPEFRQGRILCGTGICHPLIEHAVANDVFMEKNMIITGSNASGKSTFIKAVAVNLILGQSIHTCTAETMSMPKVSVLTSMAVRDDVLSGESYYIREIRYLKRMIDRSGKDRLAFFGIDEILRGTNTKERIAASAAVLRYLNQRNCILMVATHDLELAETMKESCENYHFSESVEEGDVLFDYKLYPGISDTRNAIRLLGAMGFPEEIIAAALSDN